MKIDYRNAELSYPRAIKNDKISIVLDWLLEFRFSSIDLLSKRLGTNAINSNRFFRSLIDDKLIQKFSNVHTNNERYVMLASAGLSYLEVLGRDVSKATTRVQHLGRYTQVIHDIAVQYCVLNRLSNYDEVIWDRHISLPERLDRPDVMMHSHKGFWVAFEYERWRKDTKRIYLSFVNHANGIKDQHYRGVYYLFDLESDASFYKKLFDAEEWPCYERDKKSKKIKPLDRVFKPDSLEGLRNCFVFQHSPVEAK